MHKTQLPERFCFADNLLAKDHPRIYAKAGGYSWNSNLAVAHWSGAKTVTYREAIEMESALDKVKRPSVSGKFDSRSWLHKLFDWGSLWCTAPLAAARLPFIDRYPPMIWWDYDDSDDWSSKRWARALEIRWEDQ